MTISLAGWGVDFSTKHGWRGLRDVEERRKVF